MMCNHFCSSGIFLLLPRSGRGVAYDVGGIREIIKHGQNGFLIQPGEWQDVADKILTLTQDPALYRSLAHFTDDLTDFDNNTMVKKHATLYNSLLSIKPE
ncbi:glycosyltransferase [bacterium]|nr:glycosyltransferase [bacterium]